MDEHGDQDERKTVVDTEETRRYVRRCSDLGANSDFVVFEFFYRFHAAFRNARVLMDFLFPYSLIYPENTTQGVSRQAMLQRELIQDLFNVPIDYEIQPSMEVKYSEIHTSNKAELQSVTRVLFDSQSRLGLLQ